MHIGLICTAHFGESEHLYIIMLYVTTRRIGKSAELSLVRCALDEEN